jgi:hypothetical protein
MKRLLTIVAGLLTAAALFVVLTLQMPRFTRASEPLAHARSEFSFTVRAPMSVAAPLFGPEAERGWGGAAWDPRFLYPVPAADVKGAVFTLRHAGHDSTWVATAQDFQGGHIQYVSVIEGLMVTLINIRLTAAGASETSVTVTYERTALQAGVNEHVRKLAEQDRDSGPHWGGAINDYVRTLRPVPHGDAGSKP